MSFFEFLETLTIGPLKLVLELIFSMGYYVTDRPGISIIALSIAMNILVLPLYRQADAMQERARDTDARFRRGVEHIKKTFSGDERMMILQTYYRQNNYRPTDALNGSVSLLLEVPFFMAAYQFLAHARACGHQRQPSAHPDDRHQFYFQRPVSQGLPPENQAPALRHGPVLPGFPV